VRSPRTENGFRYKAAFTRTKQASVVVVVIGGNDSHELLAYGL
jgi:hypothetical protein